MAGSKVYMHKSVITPHFSMQQYNSQCHSFKATRTTSQGGENLSLVYLPTLETTAKLTNASRMVPS
jgi:hypothetical protein